MWASQSQEPRKTSDDSTETNKPEDKTRLSELEELVRSFAWEEGQDTRTETEPRVVWGVGAGAGESRRLHSRDVWVRATLLVNRGVSALGSRAFPKPLRA